jgi:hypothetical protein
LGCFWNNQQIHIKAETAAPFRKTGKRKEKIGNRKEKIENRKEKRGKGIRETTDEHEYFER